jgi:Zn-dependent protease with chaperone function
MDPPELYVRQNPMPNAYTLAITGRKPFIVVHTSLLELLTLPELQAVIAHGVSPQAEQGVEEGTTAV